MRLRERILGKRNHFGTPAYKLEIARQRFFGDTKIGWKICSVANALWRKHPNNRLLRRIVGATLPF